MLKPTLEVEVALPEMLRPLTVVVPKPVLDISRAEMDVVERPSMVEVER